MSDDTSDHIRIRSPWGCGCLLLTVFLASIGLWTVTCRLMEVLGK
jgi:hypothetical protein